MERHDGERVMSLDDAIEGFVTPGMHLCFASTPHRSNASIRAVCRRFRRTSPEFTLSSTGFHSTAHLLARLRLGRRYIACFFGDNYPVPRPNAVYEEVAREGADIEHWSLLAYVAALRAGALGDSHAVTRSLDGSTLGEDLARRGRFTRVDDPASGARIGLVAAMRPDVTFLHAVMGDTSGRVVMAAPWGEGIWSALAAKRGAIVTVERVVDEETTRKVPESIALPPHRVIAVCPAKFGAHPQAFMPPVRLGVPPYGDDFDAYELMREVATDTDELDEGLIAAGREYEDRFELARRAPDMTPEAPAVTGMGDAKANAFVVLAARRIIKAIRERGRRVVLAGIGQAFAAARLAKLLLAEAGEHIDVVVETGLFDFDCGPGAGPFLLGAGVVRTARRLSSIEDALGAIVCGADNGCLGVIGSAEVDARGDVNSTRLAGRMLVGSGGANDIASSADEVLVLAGIEPGRLVREVEYVTSPGRHVREIVTPAGVLCRSQRGASWRIEDAIESEGIPGAELRAACPFEIDPRPARCAEPISRAEAALLLSIDTNRRASGTRRKTGVVPLRKGA